MLLLFLPLPGKLKVCLMELMLQSRGTTEPDLAVTECSTPSTSLPKWNILIKKLYCLEVKLEKTVRHCLKVDMSTASPLVFRKGKKLLFFDVVANS